MARRSHMMVSLFWFACGVVCVLVVTKLGPRREVRRRPAAPRTRRAWLERDAMRLPDPEFVARIAQIEAEVIQEQLTGERRSLYSAASVEQARRALRPTFAIRLRMKE